MNKIVLSIGAIALLGVSAVLGFKTQQYFKVESTQSAAAIPDKKVTAESVIGTQRPEFSLSDLDGQERSVSEWDGKLLVINFWATWCPPCLEEIPVFIQLQNEFAEQGLQFLGIALQTAEEVRPFYAEQGMNYPTLVGQEKVIRIAEKFGNDLGALPYTVLITPTGKVDYVKRGPLSAEKAREVIENLL